MISYDWQVNSIDFSLKYFLPTKNLLVCLVEPSKPGEIEKDIFIRAANLHDLWETRVYKVLNYSFCKIKLLLWLPLEWN
jgi:hypothetical protein